MVDMLDSDARQVSISNFKSLIWIESFEWTKKLFKCGSKMVLLFWVIVTMFFKTTIWTSLETDRIRFKIQLHRSFICDNPRTCGLWVNVSMLLQRLLLHFLAPNSSIAVQQPWQPCKLIKIEIKNLISFFALFSKYRWISALEKWFCAS